MPSVFGHFSADFYFDIKTPKRIICVIFALEYINTGIIIEITKQNYDPFNSPYRECLLDIKNVLQHISQKNLKWSKTLAKPQIMKTE